MPQFLLSGPERKAILLELIPKLGSRALGFTLVASMKAGQLVGYRIRSGDREEWAAHAEARGAIQIGSLKVNRPAIEAIAVTGLRGELTADRVFVMDELGELVLSSPRVCTAVREVFEAGATVLATIQDAPHAFIESLQRRPGVLTIDVTEESRGEVLEALRDEVVGRA